MIDLTKVAVVSLLFASVFGLWVFWVRQNDAAISLVMSCNGQGRAHFNQCVQSKGLGK